LASRRILFVTTAIDRSGAGLFEAVSGLARRLAQTPNTTVTLVSALRRRLTAEEEASWRGVNIRAEIMTSRLAAALSMRKILTSIASRDHDILHAHGLWDGASVAGAAWAQRHGRPFVLSPHGMLEPWSFAHKRFRKAIPWMLWERRAINAASVLELKSLKEARHAARLGFRNPLAAIPIGLDAFPAPQEEQSTESRRTCLYLSRIHPVKGIQNLIAAWAELRPRDWTLKIAGPEGGGYQRSLEDMVEKYGLGDTVRFIGPAYGDRKWALIRSADIFVLPSQSENFGVVVIEALSQGVPVITTTETPWERLPGRNCGWQVPPTRSGIQTALAEAVTLSPEQLRRMGECGRNYVEECFRWEVIVQDTLDLYGWVCDGGAPPRSVVCDLASISAAR
jgi:glycosyltransferase involved in cell wall biosynthesis